AWQSAQAIDKHCRHQNGSFGAVMDVNNIPVLLHRYPSPYFVGATLKYLYLTFCDDSVLPLDGWIFNHICQPLPINRSPVSYQSVFKSFINAVSLRLAKRDGWLGPVSVQSSARESKDNSRGWFWGTKSLY